MKIIGISPCLIYPDANRKVFAPKTLDYIENDTACFLARKDILPVLIPALPQPQLFDLLDKCDGFIFPGGTDIAPHNYNSTALNSALWPGDPQRDEVELVILDYAIKRNRPVLGICRGCQLINVYFGGTLYQDIPTEIPEAIQHRDANEYDLLFHDIEIKPQGYLSKIYPINNSAQVNTIHHQGIKILGNNLQIEAVSIQDNIVEAISSSDNNLGFILGVQWHPEFSYQLKDKVLNPEPLLNLFLENCYL